MVDIDALKTKFVKIPEQYSFKRFFESADISKDEYCVISRLLEENKKNIKLDLTNKDVYLLKQFGVTIMRKKEVLVSDFLNNYADSKCREIEKVLQEKKSDNYKMLSNWNNISNILRKGRFLNFVISDEECAFTISDFIDSISSIGNDKERDQQLQYIDSLLEVILSGGNIGKDFDAKFNHDRIPRYIARYHFEYTTAKFWESCGPSRTNVEHSLYQENTDFYVINGYIHKMLNGPEGAETTWWRMWWYLEILRVLRNYVDHYQPYITTDNERLAAACFILYTYVGTFYAMKQNLISCNAFKDKNPWTTARKKTLRVFYRDQISKEVSENDRVGIEEIFPQIELFEKVDESKSTLIGNKIDGCMEFTLVKGKKYLLKCGNNEPVDVPSEKIWNSPGNRPLCIWNGVRPYFFRDQSTVNAELKPYIEQAHEAAISRNAEATEKLTETITELNGIVDVLRGKLEENSDVIKELENDVNKLSKDNEDIKLGLKIIQDKQDEQIDIQKRTNIELVKHTEILDGINQRDKEREEREKAKEKREAEEDAKRKAEEDAKRKAEEEDKRKAEEEDKKRAEKERSFFRFLRYTISSISLLLCLMWLLYNIYGMDHNLVYLENNWSFFAFLLLPIFAGMGLLWAHRHYSRYSDKRQKWLDISLVAVSILFAIGAFFPNKGAERFISDYDSAQYDSVYNQKVVAYLERYVVIHKDADEIARIRLADYYMIINDGPNALRITEPMKNVTRYKEGCASAAEALYLFQKSRSVIWRIIENYKKIYHDTPPVPLQYLEGIMLFKGEGNISKIKEGFGILKRLADSGYARAQYDVGYYLCNIRVNKQNRFALIDITANSNFPDISVGGNLVEAADYLRQAATHLPEAAVELGSLYADLTVEDSAMKYLDRVTDGFYKHTPDSLLSEAFYQKALFYFTTIGNDSLAYAALDEAVNRKYLKATLYDAFLKEDPNRSIDIYNEVPNGQNIQGYSCYIPPVVFDYLSLGKDSLAYKNLVASRPHGRFNMDFVKGMKFFMRSEISRKAHLNQQVVADSTLALDYMKRSAYGENGCLYAKMICTYYNAKSDLRLGKYPVGLIKELHEIAEEIPFAYILEGYLRASNNNDSDYKLIEEASIRAMGEKHPAGAYLLTFMPEGYVEQIQKLVDGTNINKDKEELSKKSIMMQAGLRQTNRALKPYLLYSVYCLDRECDAKVRNLNFVDDKYKYYNITKMHFWADVAIANHAYYLETQLLPLAHHYKDEAYSRKLIEASLIDFPGVSRDTLKESHTIAFGGYSWETQSFQVLASFIKAMPEEYVKSLAQKYESDKVRKIFFSVDFAKKDVSPMAAPELYKVNLPLLGQISFMGLDTEDTGFHLLNEFSDIGKSVWKLDLHLEYK